jgi:rare lipoprotein A
MAHRQLKRFDCTQFVGSPTRKLIESDTNMAKLATILIFWCLTCQAADRASWYGEPHRGLLMANGNRFNPDRLTAASWFFELGTKVVVKSGHRSVVVVITDRGPAPRLVKEGRKIDLSRAAFAKLANPNLGLIDVTIKRQRGTF